MKRFRPTSWIDPALGLAARYGARRAYHRLLRDAGDAVRIQERGLLRRLAVNADSDFGRDHHFARIRNYADFKADVPIRNFEQIRPYVQRVLDGHERALFGPSCRVLMFAMTSGSTDQPKYIPVTPQFIHDYRRGWNAFGGKALLDHPEAFMRPILQVTSPLDVERTSKGVPCGSISGLLAREQSTIVRRYYAAPPEVAQISDADSRYYTIMRFAIPRDVAWIVTASPATPLKLARTADTHAERLIRDIRDGTLTPPLPFKKELAIVLSNKLEPAPLVAARLEMLRETAGALLPRDYWRLAFLANWTGGTLALHLRDFPHWFGDIPVRDIGLLATEGRISIGLKKATPVAMMDTGSGFFEFAECDGNADTVRRCHELEIGGVYRVIMTTSGGLYRYDIGDCISVAGYEGKTPLIEFLHRGSRVSSMTGEKLSEWQVTRAVAHALAARNMPAINFVSCPTWNDPPFYTFHVEQCIDELPGLSCEIDAELSRLNMEYASKQSSHRLGKVRLQELPKGSLARWDTLRREGRRSGEQYKHQYLLTEPGQDDELMKLCQSPTHPRQGQIAGTAKG